jgi:hypothetical protein
MRLKPAVAMALSLMACGTSRSAQSGEGQQQVVVSALALSFPQAGEGTLSMDLQVRDTGATAIAQRLDWELWLKGRLFATGAAQLPPFAPGQRVSGQRVSVTLPLAFHQVAVDPTLTRVRAGLKGTVTLRTVVGEERLTFALEQEVDARGAPIFERGD